MSKQYKNSPITEVICEFRFELKNEVNNSMIDLFFNKIKDTLPDRNKGKLQKIKFDVNSEKNSVDRTLEEFDQFFSSDKKTYVQLDKGRLSIHRLKPYQPWSEILPLIKLVFNSYIENIAIKSIQRIGLRYINNLKMPPGPFDIEQYFNLRPIMAGSLPQELVSFMVGTMFSFENNQDNARVQLIDQSSDINPSFFLLDIDYFTVKVNTVFKENLSKWLETAHKNVENIFEETLTDRVKVLFN
jgi:uncharacterized protein (TIGR04255 family)